jgi:xylan 1,4-beta-xylosidase
MQIHYEAIEQSGQIPVKIFTQSLELFPYHWHEETEILFILKGSIEVMIDRQATVLKAGDIFLVNRNEIHFLRSLDKQERAQLLILQFSLEQFQKYGVETNGMSFKLDSSTSKGTKTKEYHRIRSLLASMMKIVINREESQNLLIERHMLDLYIILKNHFSLPVETLAAQIREGDERLLEILKYINANYNNSSLSLNKIADQFFLTPQYLSKYFKTNIGVSLKKFIENIRLNKSLKPLRLSENNILDVALRHGFPDAKSYYRVFREVLGMTPTEFRELQKVDVNLEKPKDYFSISSKKTLSELFQYIDWNENESVSSGDGRERSVTFTVDMGGSKGKLRSSWKRIMTFGYAPHGLRQDFRRQLRTLQQDIGFEYIRFHGIFADELLVYNESPSGKPYYNFNHVDTLLDGLLEEDVRPFLELGFMPSLLASAEGGIFWWEANVTPPKSLDRWLDMVEAFVRHIINRYGMAEVSRWYFEFWNEPDLEGTFWKGTREQFFELFKGTFSRIKSISPMLKVGGFGNICLFSGDSWLRSFVSYAREHGIELDFFSFHAYQLAIDPYDLVDEKLLINAPQIFTFHEDFNEFFTANPNFRLGDENVIERAVKQTIEWTAELPMKEREYWITEWNSNIDCRDLIHDTCFMAAFIVKTALQCGHWVEGMGYWTATDLQEEFQLPQPLFHGGYGLLTYNGIKKAGFHAFTFLARLGDEIVIQREGVIVTRRGEDYQILLYNYCHYNELYNQFDYSQVTSKNRYGIFNETAPNRFGLRLEEFNGHYLLEQMRVNRKHGSSFDAWVEMGAPDKLTAEGRAYLDRMAQPQYRTWIEKAHEFIELDVKLEPHEIQLILVTKQY